ncbi:MAG: competence/damage-inducible protein A [Ignavibacteria bacterium]|jgi:nicotinamide-nucleotide amidase
MNVGLITIGDEVLIGQIVNRNAAWIAENVTMIGGRVIEHCIVADDSVQLTSTIERLRTSCSVLLLTGGLGPTHDDITKPVLAGYFNDTLEVSQEWMDHLHEWMRQRGRTVTERNAGQALKPTTAHLLTNPIGTAPGLLFDRDGIVIIAMPGVPKEMQGIMLDHVLPLMRQRIDAAAEETTEYLTLLTTGIAESNLADVIGDPTDFLGSSTLAFLPNYHGVRMRIGSRGKSSDERRDELFRVRDVLMSKAGKYVYGEGDVTLASVVGTILKEQGHTLATAESCTGGLLGSMLTDVNGSSSWFVGGYIPYANEAKVRDLGLRESTLEQFGAVSEQTATELSEAARARTGATYAISITGIAGPGGGSVEKPVGTVWISVATPARTVTLCYHFGTDRRINRERSAGAALGMLWRLIK